jgi:hypothetical protein
VRQKLTESAPPDVQQRISSILSAVTRQIARSEKAKTHDGHGLSGPKSTNRLKEELIGYAKAGRMEPVIRTFAALCDTSVDVTTNAIRQGNFEAILVLGKSGGLKWTEVKVLLNMVSPNCLDSKDVEKELFEAFIGLSAQSAQRATRFLKVRQAG